MSTYDGYGGASQFEGGGFVSTPAGMDGSTGAFASPAGKSSSRTQTNALFPVTVKQVVQALPKSADDNNLRLDGQDVQNVTLVGRVVRKDVRDADTTFVLDDGTGTIEIKRWNEGDSDDYDENNLISTGMYVRVYGHMRFWEGSRGVTAFSMRQITDFNEVTFHFMECIYVHVYNTKGQYTGGTTPVSGVTMSQQAGGRSLGGYGTGGGGGGGGSMFQTPTRGNGGNQYSAPSGPVEKEEGGLNELQKRLLALFEEPSYATSDSGAGVNDALDRLLGVFTENQIKDSISFLVNEGHLYSTTDEDHFKSTNMMGS